VDRTTAIDLSAGQARTLERDRRLRVSLQPSPWVFYAFTHDDPRISSVTSNRQFQPAGPDYPDPADYLVFTPGRLIALHAGWTKGSDPAVEKLVARAVAATAPAARRSLYRQIQRGLNARSPFMPLIQPTQAFVSTADLSGAVFSGAYDLDVTHVSPA